MNIEIENPRPRRAPDVTPSPNLDSLFRRPVFEDLWDQTGFHSGSRARRRGYRLAAWSWLASLIDTLVLVSLSCAFLLVFSFVMKTQAGFVAHELRTVRALGENFLEVFLLSSWVYMVTLRVMIGSSIGEWACDLRLGNLHERLKTRYALKVILRASLVLLTGIVTLPLLSLLRGQDVAGKISGLSLFSLK